MAQSSIVRPNGLPVQRTVQVSAEQALEIGYRMIDGQAKMLAQMGIPAPAVAAILIKTVADLVAPAQPAAGRQQILDQLTRDLHSDVAAKSREIDLALAVARGPNGTMMP